MLNLTFYIVAHFIIAFVSLTISFFVFTRNRRSITHITLALLSFSVFLWSVAYAIWLLCDSYSQALFWSRMLNLGATLIPVFLLHWILSFFKYNKKRKRWINSYYILTSIFVFFSFSKFYIWGVEKIDIFPYWPQMNWLYAIFLVVSWIPIFSYSIFLLIKEYGNRNSTERLQIIYILLGVIIGLLGGSTNFLLMLGLNIIPPAGSVLAIAFPTLLSYAVVKHRLMDIKLVLRKSTVLLSSLLTIFVPAAGIMYLFNIYFAQLDVWPNFFVLVIGVLIYPAVRDYYYRIANKYFFTSLYDSTQVVSDVSNGLKMILETNKVFSFIHSILEDVFHIKSFGVIGLDSKGKNYVLLYNAGVDTKGKNKFPKNTFLSENFIDRNKILVVEEVKEKFYNSKTKKTIDLLTELNIEVLIPLSVKNQEVGLLVLGPKETGEMYNNEDLQVLETIGAQMGVALNNAQLYTQVKSFNIKLKKEVNDATAELRTTNKRLQTITDRLASANDQLRKLDNAKSEFISIASHQLRTPLTAIKGFLSLLLEGSYGKVDKEKKDVLNKVYLSNERLIDLVEDLLNLSRIESGRMEYKFEKVDMVALCKEIYDTFVIRAKERKLKLECKKPKKKVPEVMTDRNKVREVVSNLVDNAIKYTPKGSVTMRIEVIKDRVRIAISDSGIGVPKDEIPFLFQKFSRGKDISRLNTGGTGLGLHVGKRMIEAVHGKIWVESPGANQGSTFFVELPTKLTEEEMKEVKEKED